MTDERVVATPTGEVPSCVVTLLDAFEMTSVGEPLQLSPAAQRLVALLALEPRPRSRERIASTLWPDAPADRGTANVRRALFGVLRHAPGAIVAVGHTLALAPHLSVDVRDLGLTWLGEDDELPMPKSFRMLQAELLPDWPDAWLESAREPVNALRLRRAEDWARLLLSTGHSGRALEAARVATGIDPLRESAQRLLVECHLAEGNRADAIRQFRAYEADLWRELRVRPGNDLRVLIGLEPEGATGRTPTKDDVRV